MPIEHSLDRSRDQADLPARTSGPLLTDPGEIGDALLAGKMALLGRSFQNFMYLTRIADEVARIDRRSSRYCFRRNPDEGPRERPLVARLVLTRENIGSVVLCSHLAARLGYQANFNHRWSIAALARLVERVFNLPKDTVPVEAMLLGAVERGLTPEWRRGPRQQWEWLANCRSIADITGDKKRCVLRPMEALTAPGVMNGVRIVDYLYVGG
jgi:hypothetical protein